MTRMLRITAILICFILCAALLAGCSKSDERAVLYASVDDLVGARVGVVTGTTFDALSLEYIPDCELVYLNSFIDLLPALLANKIDCFMSDGPWIDFYASQSDELCKLPDVIHQEDYAFVFAKNENGEVLRDDFNAFLQELPDLEQTLSELEEIWFNADPTAHPALDYDALPAVNGTLTVCRVDSNPPFEYYENEKIVGYDIALIYMYCENRGYAMQVDDMKFDSLIAAVNSGKYDIASSSFTITDERAESVYFSDVIYQSGPAVAILTEHSAAAQAVKSNNGFFNSIAASFEKTFIREGRWKLFLNGIGATLLITVVALLAGTLLGFSVYMWYRRGSKLSDKITGFFSWLINGMPEVLLLLIMFYIVFGKSSIAGIWVAVISFALIVCVNIFGMIKVGVDAIDNGQMEAALAIGYSKNQGFFKIILPQALQYIMPNYRAEVVSLIKSTAIVGYLAVQDLTKVSDIVRSRTYEAFFPLIATAVIYFILAWLLITLVNKLQVNLLPIRNNPKSILKGIDLGEEAAK